MSSYIRNYEASFSRIQSQRVWEQIFDLVLDIDIFKSGYLICFCFCLSFQETELNSGSQKECCGLRQEQAWVSGHSPHFLTCLPYSSQQGSKIVSVHVITCKELCWDNLPEAAQLGKSELKLRSIQSSTLPTFSNWLFIQGAGLFFLRLSN